MTSPGGSRGPRSRSTSTSVRTASRLVASAAELAAHLSPALGAATSTSRPWTSTLSAAIPRGPVPVDVGDTRPLRHARPATCQSTGSTVCAAPTLPGQDTSMTNDLPLFDCDNHIYEPPDAVDAVPPRGVPQPRDHADHARQRRAGAARRRSARHRARPPDRHGAPARRTEDHAAGDEVGEADRGLQARAAAPRVPRARAAAGVDGRAGHRERDPLPRHDGHDGRALRARHQAVVREPPLVQPVAQRDVGLRLPEPHLHAGGAVAARPRLRGRRARLRARARREVHHAERRPGLRPFARRSVLRPVLGADQRGARERGVPHR